MSWEGVDFKLSGAAFYLREMHKDLTPASDRPGMQAYAYMTSSPGTIVSSLWQNHFYHHFDAFIQAARSIPDIIQWQFGLDRCAPKAWKDTLSTQELERREKFQKEFEHDFKQFRDLPLSKVRVMTVHRTGTAPVHVEVTGQWGVIYRGGPTQSLPLVDQRPGPIGSFPEEYLPIIQSHPMQLEPNIDDFWVEGPGGSRHPLFHECQTYLKAAESLIAKARTLDQLIHNGAPLTEPPLPA